MRLVIAGILSLTIYIMIVALEGRIEMKKMAVAGQHEFINIQNKMHNNSEGSCPVLTPLFKGGHELLHSIYTEVPQVAVPLRNEL